MRVVAILIMDIVRKHIVTGHVVKLAGTVSVVWIQVCTVVAVEVCAFDKLREELLPVLLWPGLVWMPDITRC